MEAFEFLGGRYNRPEQILSGPVQAFKAQNAANGKSVFIHRVSTKEAPVEQAALLKLLTIALVKSSDAKRLVLDFGEEQGCWYVVTESEPQCALLREWLQLEIDAVTGNSRPGFSTAPAKAAALPPPPQPSGDPGEFTRFMQSRPKGGPASSFRPTTQRPMEERPARPVAAAPSKPGSGEFSNFFSSGPLPATAGERSPAEPVKTEAGEFTRFFQPALPRAPGKSGPAVSEFARTGNSRFVQRPDTPMSGGLPVAKTPEGDEPTRLFSGPDSAQSPEPAMPSGQTIEIDEPGELTMMMKGGQAQREGTPAGPPTLDNPMSATAAASPQSAAAAGLPAQVSAPRIPEPQLKIPQHVSIPPPDHIPFLMAGKKSGSRKLVMVLVMLVVLAVVLIAAMMLVMKKQ